MKPTPPRTLARKFALSLLAAGLLAAPVWGTPEDEQDAKLISELRQRTTALQKKILATQDPTEQAKLQKQLPSLLDETLPKLSEKARIPLQIAVKLVQPIQVAGGDYMQKIAEFSTSPHGDFTTIKSREDIKARIAAVAVLDGLNQGLIDRLQNFQAEAEKMVDESSMGMIEKRDFKAGMAQGFGRQIGPTNAIRNLDTRMFAIMTSALQHLDQHWGKWKTTPGEPIAWETEAHEIEFQKMMTELGVLADRQAAAQAVLSKRL